MEQPVLVVLGFGSNTGDTREILRKAVADTGKILDTMRVSSVYLTTPQDYADQPDFYNLVVAGWFHGSAESLLRKISRIENQYGRDRASGIPKGPRTLDIDIELFGSGIIRTRELIIPHERLNLRQFVLVPLLELLPDCADPVTGELFRTISGKLSDQGIKKAGNLYGN